MVDCDSKYEHIRLRSESIMTQEINLAMHLSIGQVVLDFPTNSYSIENFSRIIYQYISNVHNATKFVFRIKLPSQFDEAEFIYR